jgi:hypothetical protein
MDEQQAAQVSVPQKGEPRSAESVTLPGIYPQPKAYLEKHGCKVMVGDGKVTILYPEGTTRREVYPRTHYMRYEVALPDGTFLREIYPLRTDEGNCLYLPREA